MKRRKYFWSDFKARLIAWEFWPAWLINVPVFFMWIIQGLRNKNLLFFSCVNPSIPTGGFFSEEKWPIYKMFPSPYVPRSVLINPNMTLSEVRSVLNKNNLTYPLLAKPNIGERGMGVSKLKSEAYLIRYHEGIKFKYIIQEFISFKKEMSVLAYRYPDEQHVRVTSICKKIKLSVIGDGKTSLEELVMGRYRTRKNWSRFRHAFDGKRVLAKGEVLLLEPIGNHCRGTTFLDGNNLLDEPFRQTIEILFHSISAEVYYGRFDILFHNVEDFKSLKNFKIIEFNGVGSEPAHIYQPGFSLWKAYTELWQHARILGNIALAQKRRSVACMKWSSFIRALKVYRQNMRHVMAQKLL